MVQDPKLVPYHNKGTSLDKEKRQVPYTPSDSNNNARNQCIVTGLYSRQEKPAPTQLLTQSGVEKELHDEQGENMYRG